MRPFFLFFVFFVFFSTNCGGFKFYDGLVNSRVQSATYLTNAVTKILITLEIKNEGAENTDKYLIALPSALHDKLALVEIYDSDKNRLQIERENNVDLNKSRSVFYLVDLPFPLVADDGETTQQLKITIAYIHRLSPLPKQIKKSSKQFVVYEAAKYFYSPYFTEKFGSKYVFPSDKLKSFTKPADIDGKKLSYGPFKDIEAFDDDESVRFHFQFNVPFLTMTLVIRDIEISHWGNVRIEESYLLSHDGAALRGSYEVGMYDRMAHMMSRSVAQSDPAAVDSFRATLPSGASNVYYFDRIGNVSTSHFRQSTNEKKKSILEIRPRYPLYGGWKTDFTIGYDVPSAELISIDTVSRIHSLNVSFAIPFREPVTDLLITRIALPEGAHDVRVICPYDIELATESKRYTYLDSMIGGGRPLITFQKRNVINLHNEYFQITYVYDTTRIYYKPILIICGIASFFASIIILSRISPSLEDPMMSSNYHSQQQQQLIDKIYKLKNDDKLVNKLEKIYKKLKNETTKKKVENAIQQIKDVLKQNKQQRKAKSNKNDDDVDTKANCANILRSLQSNL